MPRRSPAVLLSAATVLAVAAMVTGCTTPGTLADVARPDERRRDAHAER